MPPQGNGDNSTSPEQKMVPVKKELKFGFRNITLTDDLKASHTDAIKNVCAEYSGSTEKGALQTFLAQCDCAIKLCKEAQLPLLYEGFYARIIGDAKLAIKDLELDTWDDVVKGLLEKYGEPETFAKCFYGFTKLKIQNNESTNDWYLRIANGLNRTIEGLDYKPSIQDSSVINFLRYRPIKCLLNMVILLLLNIYDFHAKNILVT